MFRKRNYFYAGNDDRILTKSNHYCKMMIGKMQKHIIRGELLEKTYEEIKNYISGVKKAVRAGRYRIERNKNRQLNQELYRDYVIDEAKTKKILLDLTADDFCEVLQNEHEGFEHEALYVFGKEVTLLRRFGTGTERVSLYIKFNHLENRFVIVISFHKSAYPMVYAFK